MLRMRLRKNIISLTVSILLILLLFSTLFPPFIAVKLQPGTPSDTSIDMYDTVIFDNINLTIRGPECIPVSFLNFTIFEGSTEIAYVKFNVLGSEIEDSPSNIFTVTNITDTSNLPYNSSGGYGYDEDDGSNHIFNYGYGNANSGASDLIILYRITYTAHLKGTFTAKLFVNSSNYTYVSGPSLNFTVSEGEILDPYPTYESTGVSRPPTNLSVKINGTNLDVYFYLYNMTPIADTWIQFANWTSVSSPLRCEFTNFTDMGNDWLWGNTSYHWSVNATNGSTWSNTSYYYTTTGSRYDVSNDGIVNVQDLSYTWGYRTGGSKPHDDLYNVNNDGSINSGDLSAIWTNRT